MPHQITIEKISNGWLIKSYVKGTETLILYKSNMSLVIEHMQDTYGAIEKELRKKSNE